MATAEQEMDLEFDSERLELATEANEEALGALHDDERRIRYSDLDGDYRRPETRFNWSEEDKLARQMATLAEWGPQAVREFREELQSIEDDGRYSDEFKREKKAELAREYLEADSGGPDRGRQLVRTSYEIGRLRSKVEARAQDFRPFDPPNPETSGYSAAREREIREQLAQETDAGKRLRRARELVDSGDPESVRAVLNPPAGTSPIAEENVQLLKKRALENRYGDQPEQLAALRGLADLAYGNLQEARREIARLGGVAADK